MSEKTTDFASGAVRSAAVSHLDFTSIPLVGLIGVARTAAEGGEKYGRHNYMLGMPAHDQINHAICHVVLFLLGDRSEPHLEHAAWGLLAAIQSVTLDPGLNAPHLLGPGATVTTEMKADLDARKGELRERRDAGEFKDSDKWFLSGLPEITKILGQRDAARAKGLACRVNQTVKESMSRAEAEATRALAERYAAGLITKKSFHDHMGGCPPLP